MNRAVPLADAAALRGPARRALTLRAVAVGVLAVLLAAPAVSSAQFRPIFISPVGGLGFGGGLVGDTGSNVTIGSGPWTATYSGVVGLLAPPTVTIGSGRGAISGIAGAGAFVCLRARKNLSDTPHFPR